MALTVVAKFVDAMLFFNSVLFINSVLCITPALFIKGMCFLNERNVPDGRANPSCRPSISRASTASPVPTHRGMQ
jgi:hypothetical protein